PPSYQQPLHPGRTSELNVPRGAAIATIVTGHAPAGPPRLFRKETHAMAVIKPFRAVRYDPQRIGDMHTVISQPYDRIGVDLQAQYYGLSPHNVVRIIEG